LHDERAIVAVGKKVAKLLDFASNGDVPPHIVNGDVRLIRNGLGKELARQVGSPSAGSDPSSILASYVAFKFLKACDSSVPRTLHNIICDTT
jgi:hypothetical protein